MKTRENNMFKAINEGRAPIGFFNYIKDPTIQYIAGSVGMDFTIIDMEHAVMDRETVEVMVMAAELNEVTPLVRMPDLIPWQMRSLVEMGVKGVLIPHVRDKETALKAQRALRYPPEGTASTCRSNHATGFRPQNWQEYMKEADKVSFIPMIEDPEGVEHLEEILSVLKPGRDMVMFGKADYGQALGGLKEDGTFPEEVQKGYERTIELCRKHGIWFMACPSAPASGQKTEHVQKVIDEGCCAVCLNTDQLVIGDALDKIVSGCRNMKLKRGIGL